VQSVACECVSDLRLDCARLRLERGVLLAGCVTSMYRLIAVVPIDSQASGASWAMVTCQSNLEAATHCDQLLLLFSPLLSCRQVGPVGPW
jgi:hypothetical protein